MRRVVITGIGVISPCGNNIDGFWKNSISGKSFTTGLDKFEELNLLSRVQGAVKGFDYKDFNLTDEEAARMGRPTHFALAATHQAIDDSGLILENEDRERIGVCLSSAIADTPCAEHEFLKIKDLLDGDELITNNVDENLFKKAMFNCIITEISSRYQLYGPALNMSTGCTGGIDAIGYGYETIQFEDADIMICGSTEAPLAGISFASFDRISATSRKNEFPEKASSPFDLSRDGFVLAEGAGILILEEYERAKKRGASIYCEIGGYDSCNNAWHMTDLPDSGATIIRIIKKVLDESDLKPENIDYINAHGSATPQNDIFETSAYKTVLGEHAYKVPVSSTKSIIGHPLAAASAIESVHCCLILSNNVVPPTINYETPDPQCDLDYVPNVCREVDVNNILKDASGFSGLHSAIVFKKLQNGGGK